MTGAAWCSGPLHPAAEQRGIPGMTQKGSCVNLCLAVELSIPPSSLSSVILLKLAWGEKKKTVRVLQTRPPCGVNHSNSLTHLKTLSMHMCTCGCTHAHLKNTDTSWVIEDLGLGPGYFLRL